MAEKSVPQDIKYVNPMFPIPEGLVGFEYSNDPPVNLSPEALEDAAGDIATDDYSGVANDSQIPLSDSPTDDYSGAIVAPTTLTVIDQPMHMATTGQQVVDLIVNVGDVPGALRYEFRVTKAE